MQLQDMAFITLHVHVCAAGLSVWFCLYIVTHTHIMYMCMGDQKHLFCILLVKNNCQNLAFKIYIYDTKDAVKTYSEL